MAGSLTKSPVIPGTISRTLISDYHALEAVLLGDLSGFINSLDNDGRPSSHGERCRQDKLVYRCDHRATACDGSKGCYTE